MGGRRRRRGRARRNLVLHPGPTMRARAASTASAGARRDARTDRDELPSTSLRRRGWTTTLGRQHLVATLASPFARRSARGQALRRCGRDGGARRRLPRALLAQRSSRPSAARAEQSASPATLRRSVGHGCSRRSTDGRAALAVARSAARRMGVLSMPSRRPPAVVFGEAGFSRGVQAGVQDRAGRPGRRASSRGMRNDAHGRRRLADGRRRSRQGWSFVNYLASWSTL